MTDRQIEVALNKAQDLLTSDGMFAAKIVFPNELLAEKFCSEVRCDRLHNICIWVVNSRFTGEGLDGAREVTGYWLVEAIYTYKAGNIKIV